MNLTLEDLSPPDCKATPLTDKFAAILIVAHGGQENVGNELAAALHVMRTIELAAQQFNNLSLALADGNPSLLQVVHLVLTPIHELGRSMDAALTETTLEESLAAIPPSVATSNEDAPQHYSHLSDPSSN